MARESLSCGRWQASYSSYPKIGNSVLLKTKSLLEEAEDEESEDVTKILMFGWLYLCRLNATSLNKTIGVEGGRCLERTMRTQGPINTESVLFLIFSDYSMGLQPS